MSEMPDWALKLLFMGGLGLLLILVGLFLYRLRAREHAKALAALAWPRAAGQVVASVVADTTMPGGEDGDISAYVPQVTYSYAVGGQAYQGGRISFADLRETSRTKPEATVAKYPAGTAIQVAYDPADPAQSVLEPGTKGTSPWSFNVIFLFAAGIVCFVLAFII